jgi:hypothetical protein
MSATLTKAATTQTKKDTSGRLLFLDLGGGRVLSANPDGSDLKTIVVDAGQWPDGLAIDVAAGHIYWTSMGNPKANDGSILRSDLDGRNKTTIVPPGGTFTPKQLQIEKTTGKLYWCDREGMPSTAPISTARTRKRCWWRKATSRASRTPSCR